MHNGSKLWKNGPVGSSCIAFKTLQYWFKKDISQWLTTMNCCCWVVVYPPPSLLLHNTHTLLFLQRFSLITSLLSRFQEVYVDVKIPLMVITVTTDTLSYFFIPSSSSLLCLAISPPHLSSTHWPHIRLLLCWPHCALVCSVHISVHLHCTLPLDTLLDFLQRLLCARGSSETKVKDGQSAEVLGSLYFFAANLLIALGRNKPRWHWN